MSYLVSSRQSPVTTRFGPRVVRDQARWSFFFLRETRSRFKKNDNILIWIAGITTGNWQVTIHRGMAAATRGHALCNISKSSKSQSREGDLPSAQDRHTRTDDSSIPS